MIISASYRTDLPGYYARWFERRYLEGFCLVAGPFDGRLRRVALQAPEAQAFVFWTRNVAPFLPVLGRLHADGMPFVVQYTLTGYPRQIESHAPAADRAVSLCHEVRERFGEGVLVWRYDPILLTSLTDADYHRHRFAELCGRLAGATDEVVVSFATMYRKTTRNLDRVAQATGLTYEDPEVPWKQAFLLELAGTARAHGLKLSVCSQRELLRPGLADAACVDLARLERVAGGPLVIPRRAHRPACGCYASVDIGAYDACPTGCVYCYAVRNRATGDTRYHEHHPEDLLLWRPRALRHLTGSQLMARATGEEDPHPGQMVLFDEF